MTLNFWKLREFCYKEVCLAGNWLRGHSDESLGQINDIPWDGSAAGSLGLGPVIHHSFDSGD